jgi:hypothetical protein
LKSHSPSVSIRKFIPVFFIISISLTACAPQVELTSSWTNKQAQTKSSPLVMALVMGRDLHNRQMVEQHLVAEFTNLGIKAVSSLDYFKPDVQKYDSATMVQLLRENKIDQILITGITNVSEKERYVPGTTERVPVGSYATPYNPYYYSDYNNYYNYYNYQSTYYQTVYETRETPGYTVTDVEVVIESRLFDVSNANLLWYGQSTSYTKEPSTELFNQFAKSVTADIKKNNVIK